MKLKWVLLWSLLALLNAGPVAAQNDCGDGLPCGRIPWGLPVLPTLASPTPMPTIPITINPPTSTPGGPTATPAPTEVSVDTSGLNDQFATLQNLIAATDIPVVVSGTPVSAGDQLDSLASGSYTFFGYVRGVSELDLGGLTPLLTFLIVSLITVIAVKSLTFIMPVLAAIYAFIKSIVDFVLSLLPF